ncbi:hypothetical protein [Calidifontibacillus erzurumensis]|uniref:hypothetical protein n=1 Tax=Calidifontibacillus erzurumensis TaxID=2741433 RepID=UPI0035B53473
MPRIEKVRITGVQYDKMRKHYENTIFDFINEEDPQHTLLTLVNGGGKGMLLQLIFQTMMPLTTWGKNGENHIDALFYNEKRQFVPYTFHVAIEWRLDTEPTEWLVSGICITSERKVGQDTEEAETEPQYFLYTSKYQKPANWSIDTLPLYDEEKKQAVSFEEWDSWLKKHKNEFQYYPKSKLSAYHKYLSSYGIEKNEWRHMREINRDEGGIEHYFKKGLDNFGLFHNLIIPEISHYLEEEQEENLMKIFRDNFIIFERLPKLLERENIYELLKEKLLIIQDELNKGLLIETSRKEHYEYANYLYFAMEEKLNSLRFEEDKWKEENEKTVSLQKEALWEKDNLEYAKQCKEHHEASEQLKEIEENVAAIKEKLETYTLEKNELEIDIKFLEYLFVTKELEAIDKQISKLENEENLHDEKTQIQQMKEQLESIWEAVEKELQREVDRFETLKQSYQKNLHLLENQIAIDEKEISDLKLNMKKYTDFIKTHNEKARRMEQQYGDIVNRNPEFVVNKKNNDLKEVENKMNVLKQQEEALIQKQREYSRLEGELVSEKKTILDKQEEAKKQREKRQKEEQHFHKEWCKFLHEDIPYQTYTTEKLNSVESELREELARLQSADERLKKDFWNHQLDTMLVNDHYWIPNNDIRKVVEQLEELGVHAMYGTELINELSEEDRATYINRFPLLPYGVVIHEREWEQRVDEYAFQHMLSHSAVPIFIRERMNEDVLYAFEVPREKGIEMAFDKEKWIRWKGQLEEKTENFKRELEKLENRIKTTNELLEKLKQLKISTIDEMLAMEETLHQKLMELVAKENELKEENTRLAEKQKQLANELKELHQQRDQLNVELPELKTWVKEHEKYNEYKELKAETNKKLLRLEKQVQESRLKLKGVKEELDSWEKSFEKWKIRCEFEINALKDELPSIRFPESKEITKEDIEAPQLDETLFNEMKPILKQIFFLRQKINNANNQLTELRADRKHQQSEQQKLEERLNKFSSNWKEREYPSLPKQILVEHLQTKEKYIKETELVLRQEERKFSRLQGKLEQLDKNKQNLEKRILDEHNRPAEDWFLLDLEEKEKSIKERLDKIARDLQDQNKILEDISKRGRLLMKQQDILKSHISLLKQVGEIPVQVKEKIQNNPEQAVHQWIGKKNELNKSKEDFNSQYNEYLKGLRETLQYEKMDESLRNRMNQLIPQLESESLDTIIQIVESVIVFIQNELILLKKDKQKQEEAQELWLDRAVFRVLTILQSIKRMVDRMKIKNKEGHLFPLVKIERIHEIISTEEEEFRRLLREHFIKTIKILLETGETIENITDAKLKQYMSDSQLVLVSLRNRYPTLSIYKPQTTNAFLYEKPRNHHYTSWETLNKGCKIEAKGSGGQVLAARTIVMMMIMTFKRQENNSNWSVLITDNPFGQAVSAHILDPIFSIADTLKFQWIVLAPPELIKLDVSRRFPVYWKLELKQHHHGEVIKEVLQHGGRTFEDVEWTLF